MGKNTYMVKPFVMREISTGLDKKNIHYMKTKL